MYRIVANKLKTGNIMFSIKKANETMTTDWQETADEIIKGLFLKDNEAVVGDRLLSGRKCIEIQDKETHRFIKTKENPGPRRNQSRNISENF